MRLKRECKIKTDKLTRVINTLTIKASRKTTIVLPVRNARAVRTAQLQIKITPTTPRSSS